MNYFLEKANEMKDKLIGIRRDLHQMPELGMDLPKTSSYIEDELNKLGIESERICKNGITACIGGKHKGKVFMLRADMDALPMKEDSGLDFASKGENAHTCGHDFHAAMLLGAAKLLKDREEDLIGTVKLMFQPGEETLNGAISLIQEGILENPHVDAAMGLHVIPGDLHVGTVAWNDGPILASSDAFKIIILGSPGHGAFPQNSVDAVNIAAHILITLQEINAREIDPQDPLVLSVCTIHGGNALNIFPEKVEMSGTIRAFSEKNRQLAKNRLEEICKSMASLFRGKCEVEFLGGTAAVVNNKELIEELVNYAGDLTNSFKLLPKMMGSEDFAEITQRIPAAFFNIGAGGIEEVYNRAQCHNPKIVYNENVLPFGTALYANCAFNWLKNQQ